MKIEVISVGKIKESYLLDGIKEYAKRLSKYAQIIETTLQDEAIKDKDSEALNEQIKVVEGEKILKAISPKSYVIALDLKGNMLSSEELAEKIDDVISKGNGHIVFVIGGSLGLSKNVLARADYRLCFSKMTFPHKLMKLILLEQVYRAFKINNHETYHK